MHLWLQNLINRQIFAYTQQICQLSLTIMGFLVRFNCQVMELKSQPTFMNVLFLFVQISKKVKGAFQTIQINSSQGLNLEKKAMILLFL